MRLRFVAMLGKMFLALVLTAFMAMSTLVLADVVRADTLDTQVSLSTRPTISQGEPILLHYKISNSSDQKVGVHWGLYRTEWYTLSLADAAGRAVPPIPDSRPRDPRGAFGLPNPFLTPGQSVEGDLAVTRLFKITRPGRYTLTMRVHMPYVSVPLTEEDPLQVEKTLKTDGTTYTQDLAFPVVITQADPSRLQATADALCQAIVRDQYGLRHDILMSALFSMPEAQAAASWQALAGKPGVNADMIATYLGQTHSARAADILAQMLRDPTLSPDNVTAVSRCLNEMYNTGDATLRGHIKQIAASGGITLPEQVTIPQAID